jgi:hypothetical protein
MAWNLDARIPVRFGPLDQAGGDDALIVEGGPAPRTGAAAVAFELDGGGHPAGCACCVARSPAAQALYALFQARAKGEVPFFRRVLAVTRTPEGDLAVWSAVRNDPLAAGRFRLEDG